MNRTEHLLTTLGEEACEIAGRVSKSLRFGLDEVQPGQPLSNRERIIDEFHDMIGMMEMLVGEGVFPANYMPTNDRILAKIAKVEKFMAISREQGVLS
jgi:hypothetical protein